MFILSARTSFGAVAHSMCPPPWAAGFVVDGLRGCYATGPIRVLCEEVRVL